MVLDNRIYELSRTASFMTGDGDLWVTNRFERLHLINVLAIQQRLIGLEEKVNGYLAHELYLEGHNVDVPADPQDSSQVLEELKKTIQEYSNAIRSLMLLRNSDAPAPHIIDILKKSPTEFSKSIETAGSPKDSIDIAQRQIAVGAKPQDWIHRYIARHERIACLFEEVHNKEGEYYTKFSESRLKKVEFGLVAICLCLVQLLPVLALTLVSSKRARLGVIIVLIVLVSTMNAVFANTVRATNFGAIAAYSAVVVVFLTQNN